MSVSVSGPAGRNPTAKPTASVVTMPQATSTVSASARPAASVTRGIGSDRRRSMTPRCDILGDTGGRVHAGEQHAARRRIRGRGSRRSRCRCGRRSLRRTRSGRSAGRSHLGSCRRSSSWGLRANDRTVRPATRACSRRARRASGNRCPWQRWRSNVPGGDDDGVGHAALSGRWCWLVRARNTSSSVGRRSARSSTSRLVLSRIAHGGGQPGCAVGTTRPRPGPIGVDRGMAPVTDSRAAATADASARCRGCASITSRPARALSSPACRWRSTGRGR